MHAASRGIREARIGAGIEQPAADAFLRRLNRRAGPAAMSILIGAVIGGFGLIAVGMSRIKNDVEAVEAGPGAVETGISTPEVRMTDDFTRIETILEERLPERRRTRPRGPSGQAHRAAAAPPAPAAVPGKLAVAFAAQRRVELPAGVGGAHQGGKRRDIVRSPCGSLSGKPRDA